MTRIGERHSPLDTLPKDLFEKYRRIIDRVNDRTPGNRSLVKWTLQWILFSEELIPEEKTAMVVTIEINSDYVTELFLHVGYTRHVCVRSPHEKNNLLSDCR
jgi:hypothetical protein